MEGEYFIEDGKTFAPLPFKKGDLSFNMALINSEWWTREEADEEVSSDAQMAVCSEVMPEFCKKEGNDPRCLVPCKMEKEAESAKEK